MGKPVSSDVKRVETTAINTKINKKVLDDFRDCLKEQGYSMNIILETFMRQYSNGKFDLSDEDIFKWKNDNSELDTLSTTFSKEIYINFKYACKFKGYFVKYVITAFMEKYISKEYVLEYVNIAKK